MYELIQLTERTYYIKSPTNIGLFRLDEKNVCLIDSGNDKDAGRRIRQVLDANGWQLTAIYNTHANADHIGGNQYLQNQTGCKVYAPGIECDFTRDFSALGQCKGVIGICDIVVQCLANEEVDK